MKATAGGVTVQDKGTDIVITMDSIPNRILTIEEASSLADGLRGAIKVAKVRKYGIEKRGARLSGARAPARVPFKSWPS